MAVSATEVDNILVRLVGDASSYQKMIDNAVSSTKSATTSIQQSSSAIQGVADSIGALAGSVNQMLIAVAGTGQTLTAFMQFDKALTESVAIMKVTDDQINQMRRSALDLAPAAGLGPEALARGFYYLASAGLEAQAAIKSLPAIVNFAVAGNFDLARATTLAADAQAALGLKTQDAAQNLLNLTRVTDVLVKGNVLSNTTTEQLSLALTTNAAAAGRAFGKSIEEVTAVLAVYADQGTKAQVAGNAFSRALRLLAYSAIQHKAAFEQLGIAVFNDAGKMRNMADIVDDLDKALGPLNDKSRAAALNFLGFEARIQQAIIPLLGTSAKMREFQKTLEGAGGAAEEVAEKTRSSLNFQIRALSANIKVLAVEIGSFFAPAMALVANIINTSINLWRSLSIEVKNASIAIGTALLTFAGLGPIRALLGGLGGLVTASIAPVILIFMSLAKVIINPFLLLFYWFNPTFILFRNLISIVAAVVVAMQKAGGAAEFFREVQDALIGVYEYLKPIGEALIQLGSTVLRKIIQGFTALGEAMLISIKIALDYININWKVVQDTIISGIGIIELGVIHFEDILYAVGGALVYIGKIILDVVNSFLSYSNTVQAAIKQTTTFKDQVYSTFVGLLNIVDAFVSGFIGGVIGGFVILIKVVSKVSEAFSGFGKSQSSLNERLTALAGVIGVVVGVVTVLYLAYKLLMIQQILNLTSTLLLNAAYVAYAAVNLALAPIIWSVNFALTATTALMAALSLFVVALGAILSGVIVGGFVALAAAIWGAYKAGEAIFDQLKGLPRTSGPISEITSIFKDWLGVIGLVAEAVRVDMDLAWQIAVAGFNLAVAQIRDLWPPLWEFIKSGWSALAKLAAATFQNEFNLAVKQIAVSIFSLGRTEEEVAKKRKQLYDAASERSQKAVDEAQDAMSRAINTFNSFPIGDSPQIAKAKKVIEDFRKQLAVEKEDKEWEALYAAIDALEDPLVKAQKEAQKLAGEGEKIDQQFGKAKHTVDNLTASIVGSAEAATRMQKYLDLFFLGDTGLAKLNQEGVQSGAKALGLTQEYKGDPEWAKARAEMEDAEKWAESAGATFVNELQSADWKQIGLDVYLGIADAAFNVKNFTKPAGEIQLPTYESVLEQLRNAELGLPVNTELTGGKSDVLSLKELLQQIVANTREMADEKSFWDFVDSGGLEA